MKKVCKETAWLRDCASNEGQRAFTIKLKHCQSLDGIMSAPKATGSHDLPKAINNIAQHYYTDPINEITKTERQLKSARAMLNQSMELTVFNELGSEGKPVGNTTTKPLKKKFKNEPRRDQTQPAQGQRQVMDTTQMMMMTTVI